MRIPFPSEYPYGKRLRVCQEEETVSEDTGVRYVCVSAERTWRRCSVIASGISGTVFPHYTDWGPLRRYGMSTDTGNRPCIRIPRIPVPRMSDDQNVPASKTLGFCDTLRLMPSGRRKQGGLNQRDVPSADKARSGYRHRVDLTPPYSEKAFNSSIRLNGNRPGVFLPKASGKSRFACFPPLFVFRPFRALCFSVSAFCFCRLLFSSGHMHRFEAHGGGD